MRASKHIAWMLTAFCAGAAGQERGDVSLDRGDVSPSGETSPLWSETSPLSRCPPQQPAEPGRRSPRVPVLRFEPTPCDPTRLPDADPIEQIIIADPQSGPTPLSIARSKGRTIPLSMSPASATPLERALQGAVVREVHVVGNALGVVDAHDRLSFKALLT